MMVPDSPARACYLLPLRWEPESSGEGLAGLTGYLRKVARSCDVLVVDGSSEAVFARHHSAWSSFACHIRPAPSITGRNGKVRGVVTGVRTTAAQRVVIADDDVRYDDRALAQVLDLLSDADLVIPQNYFRPLPWHAAWDSARILINRGLGMDYPGTLAVRRDAFLRAGCYDADVLFENLELIRTLRAAGARVAAAPHVLVRRLPPGVRHFRRQRVRQAYDSLAQPPRLAAELALLPAAVFAVATRRSRYVAMAAGLAVGVAQRGRRRHGGAVVFPWYLPLLAPGWLAERSVCSWLALACRLRGGVWYAGQRLCRAANPVAALRREAAAREALRSTVGSPEAGPCVRPVTERLDA